MNATIHPDEKTATGRTLDAASPSAPTREIAGALSAFDLLRTPMTFRAGPAVALEIPAPSHAAPPIPSLSAELFYDTIADEFDAVMNRYDLERRLDIVFNTFLAGVDLRGRTLLDAGCGTGWFSRAACARGARVTALDIGPRLLSQVRMKCAAQTRVGNILSLDIEDNSYDVVISSECIEHTHSPRRAVQELIRVCRPGGLIAVTSNNHTWHWLCALANHFNWRPYKGIENWPRWHDFHAWFAAENVRILDRRGFHLFPFQVSFLQPVLKRLDAYGRILGRLCVNQGILATKLP